ncbi:uncharacterized protein BDW70DRAFT_140495 [Aspergillus foveolatus]|uniref:uncharacterized protein n=1 Tax=Aspergillus foveolatus TaxID=210207 RepID=UPI003CCD1E2E
MPLSMRKKPLPHPRAPGPRSDEKESLRERKVPKNTPVNDPKAVEQTVPPRCAMQGPVCGGPPS